MGLGYLVAHAQLPVPRWPATELWRSWKKPAYHAQLTTPAGRAEAPAGNGHGSVTPVYPTVVPNSPVPTPTHNVRAAAHNVSHEHVAVPTITTEDQAWSYVAR